MFPGLTYHAIARILERRFFLDEPGARSTYLRLLARAILESDWTCRAYALMSNHIHLQLQAGTVPFGDLTKRIHTPFANWFNAQQDRIGPVFAHRPKLIAFLRPSEGALTAYIHNNPVRAGVVAHARDSSWTSHRAYVGLERAPAWLDVDGGLARAQSDRTSFDQFVESTPGSKVDPDSNALRAEVARLRNVDIGTPAVAGQRVALSLLARPSTHVRPPASIIVRAVADATNVPWPIICSPRKLASAVTARTLVAQLGFGFGLTGPELARQLGVTGQNVHRLGRKQLGAEGVRVLHELRERIELEMWGRVG
ncbi:hypothetical protein BH11MYX2_BH11MYX2_25230 [soil metagenome]